VELDEPVGSRGVEGSKRTRPEAAVFFVDPQFLGVLGPIKKPRRLLEAGEVLKATSEKCFLGQIIRVCFFFSHKHDDFPTLPFIFLQGQLVSKSLNCLITALFNNFRAKGRAASGLKAICLRTNGLERRPAGSLVSRFSGEVKTWFSVMAGRCGYSAVIFFPVVGCSIPSK